MHMVHVKGGGMAELVACPSTELKVKGWNPALANILFEHQF
jgi:hypothetical protein